MSLIKPVYKKQPPPFLFTWINSKVVQNFIMSLSQQGSVHIPSPRYLRAAVTAEVSRKGSSCVEGGACTAEEDKGDGEVTLRKWSIPPTSHTKKLQVTHQNLPVARRHWAPTYLRDTDRSFQVWGGGSCQGCFSSAAPDGAGWSRQPRCGAVLQCHLGQVLLASSFLRLKVGVIQVLHQHGPGARHDVG